MDNPTKTKVVKGFKWTGVEAIVTQALQFIISIIIARMLLPRDYGILGMLEIFMAISATFVNSGFGSALIQKKEVSGQDYSTAFYFNIFMAVFLYGILWCGAPFIAEFYNQPLLVSVTRIYSLTLIISAFSAVHWAILSRTLNFKTNAIISIVSLMISGITGIVMAYKGYGVWALVAQGVVSSIANSVLLWGSIKWIPMRCFSKESFKALFGYGSKILCSSIINTIYSNISTLIIGKAYHATDLGLYTKAKGFACMPGGVLTNIALKVNFPVLSRYQDNNEQLLSNYRLLLRAPVFILFPILSGMAALARPLIEVVLGNKWIECYPMLIILCFGYLWSPLTSINLNLLYVKGRTDLVLKLELIKKPIAFFMLFSAIPLGIYGMCAAVALYEFVAFSFNSYYTGKMLNYGFKKQIIELLPIFGYCAAMTVAVLTIVSFIRSSMMQLAIGILVGMAVYVSLTVSLKDKTAMMLQNRISARFKAIMIKSERNA